jgi:hypothetical protein
MRLVSLATWWTQTGLNTPLPTGLVSISSKNVSGRENLMSPSMDGMIRKTQMGPSMDGMIRKTQMGPSMDGMIRKTQTLLSSV